MSLNKTVTKQNTALTLLIAYFDTNLFHGVATVAILLLLSRNINRPGISNIVNAAGSSV